MKEYKYLVVNLTTIQRKDDFPVGLLLSPLEKIGSLQSKYITDCLVVFREETERVEAIKTLLTQKGIKAYTRKTIRKTIHPFRGSF